MPLSLSQRSPRRRSLWFASFLLLVTFYAIYTRSFNHRRNFSIDGPPECPPLPGVENVLLVLKTGVTEAPDKLPVHRNTTLRCIPNSIVWSDYEEELADIPVHDVLYNESSHLHQLADFNLYTRVQTHGRSALTSSDLVDDPSTPFGKSNPGWKMDKWKFLPMIEHTFRHNPKANWYVFMEADTYIFWPSMLAWLAKLDHTRPYYLGNQMQIRDVVFAHGGSGFVLSRPAMERAADLRAEKREYWDAVTEEEWAGDCVLGILLKDAGVSLHWAWPMLQLAPPKEIDHFAGNYGRTPWCYPAVSFHHLRPSEIRELNWLDRTWSVQGTPLLYRDFFWQWARPRMSEGPVEDWDNMAALEKKAVRSVSECREICEQNAGCLQYILRVDGMCAVAHDARLGEAREGFKSGWMLDRIDQTAKGLGSCPHPQWVL